jgi:preprotein translocase subunit SecF
VIAGTYSSIGIATNFLVAWEAGSIGRLFRRGQPKAEASLP